MNKQCFCDKKYLFKDCCEPFINQKKYANEAVDLMRSRYTAYSLKNKNYLIYSSAESAYHDMLTLNVNETIQWLSLQIIRTTKGKLNDTVGKVHFKAFFECNHSISFVEEISTFKK